MLGLNWKRADQVDLLAPLREFIISNHSKEDAKKLEDAIQAVNRGRQMVIMGLDRTSPADYQTALKATTDYLSTFNMLTNRFPWGDHKRETFLGFKTGKIPTIKVKFSYYDAWRKNKKVEDSKEPAYEKAWLIYNMAALNSLDACREKKNPDDGLKRAMALFQTSAGLFQYMIDTPELCRSSAMAMNQIDLTADAIALCVNLMLAQAQACFFEKASSANSSPGLTAKLAAGTAKLFKTAQASMEKTTEIKNWLSSSDYKWATHCSYQHLIYTASAHFWHSKSLIAADDYGGEISHLNRATELLKEAGKIESGLKAELAETRTKLSATVSQRLALAIKDNQTIYYKPVPATPGGEIEQKVVVKPTPYKPPAEAETNAFSVLVPTKIAEAASEFVAKVSGFVGTVDKHRADMIGEAKAHLMARNLPAALEAMEPALGLPEEVWSRIKEVQYKGGAKALLDVHSQLQLAVKEAWGLHGNIKDILAKEAKTDSDMRTQFGVRWTRRPSPQITASYQRDLDACEKFLHDANASDSKIGDDWKSNEGKLADLASTHDQLEAKLPRLDAGAEDGNDHKSHADTLKHLLNELSALMDRRQEATEALKKVANGIDIVPILLAAQKSAKTSEQVANDELAKLNVQFLTLKEIDAEQQQLLAQITSSNEEFVKSRGQNASAAARESVLQGLNVSVDCYNKLQNNLNEGLKFYSDLLRDFLEPLKQSVTDFMTARNMECQMILQQLTEDISNYKQNNDSSRMGANEKSQPASPAPSGGAYSAPAFNPNMYSSPSGGSSHPQLPSKQVASPSFGSAASAPPAGGGGYEPLDMTPSAPGPYAPPGGLSTQMPSLSNAARPIMPQSGAARPAYPGAKPLPVAMPAPAGGGAGDWSCPTCTFVNKSGHLQCSMCSAQAPNGAGGGGGAQPVVAIAVPAAVATPAVEPPKKKSWFS